MTIRLRKEQEYFLEYLNGHVEVRYLGKAKESRFFENQFCYVVTDDFLVTLIGRRLVWGTNPPIIPPKFIPKKDLEELEEGKVKSRLTKILKSRGISN